MINFAKLQLLSVSHRTLKILAVLLWLIGGIMLIRKASELLIEAYTLNPLSLWTWFAIAIGLLLGSLKAKYLFNKSCRKNIERIDALDVPKLWQFYRPNFFFLLALMISVGVTLSRLSHGSYPFLVSVAALDLSIATALLVSSRVFFAKNVFAK